MVPRPPPVASFSLCGLRLFVIKRICLSPFSLVAMKAGCKRAFASLPAEAVALAPPLPLACLGGLVVPPPPVAVPVLPASLVGAFGRPA